MSTKVNFLQRVIAGLNSAFERAAQARTRRYLLGLSDRSLADMGFSRELLEQGAKAWPWRMTEEPHRALRLPATMPELNSVAGREVKRAARFSHPGTDAKLAA